MSRQRDIRRLAMQVLYQIDLRGQDDQQLIRESLADGPDDERIQEQAFELAQEAWLDREAADRRLTLLAPQWPTHRQPPVDRAIMRLAHHEIISGRTPYKIAINEAIELAKQFGSEHSASFINGVLDKFAKQLPPPKATEGESKSD